MTTNDELRKREREREKKRERRGETAEGY